MKKIIFLNLFLINFYFLYANDNEILSYLLIDSYPEYSATGESIGAANGTIPAISLNPAVVLNIKDFELSVMYNMLPVDITNQKITLGKKLGIFGIALEISLLDFGQISKIEMAQNEMPLLLEETITPKAFIASFCISSKILNDLAIGIKPKMIYEDFFTQKNQYYFFDFGLIQENFVIKNFDLGFSIINFSRKIGSFYPPLHVKTTLEYTIYDNSKPVLIFGFSNSYFLYDSFFKNSFGIQYNFLEKIPLRIGFIFDKENELNLCMGVGINIKNILLNYSLEIDNDIGNINKFSINTFIDDSKSNKNEEIKSSETNFENMLKSADYYYKERQYKNAIKYYEYINLIYWKEIEEMNSKDKSNFYQKIGICYYNSGDKIKAKQYFERALFYDKDNEILKYWADLIK